MLTQHELKKMDRLHELWLEGKPGGQYADFSGMELAHLDFDGTTFEAAAFRGARISDCCLCGNFVSADFRGAELRNVYAGYSLYESADFTSATCQGCDFTHTKFDGAHMRRARFDGCDFTRAKLEFCDMTAAQFNETTFQWTATAGSWGIAPPARDMKTLLAESQFESSMMETGFWDKSKTAEWMDEAWSEAQDQTDGCEPKRGPREPEYRDLLKRYAAAFAQVRARYPAEAETLYGHGEEFLPEELPVAAAQFAAGSSMDTLLDLKHHGLLRPENADDLARVKEAVGRMIEDALSFPGDGEACFDLDLLGAYYGFDGPDELSLLDLLGEREEVVAARLDFDEDVIALELNPAFVSGMTMTMQ